MRRYLIGFLTGTIILGIPAAFAVRGMFYRDVPSNEWYTDAVNEMTRLGLFDGYPDGTFRPANYVNRAELAVVLQQLVHAVQAAEAPETPQEQPPPPASSSNTPASSSSTGDRFILWHASDMHVDDLGDNYRKEMWMEVLEDMNNVPWDKAVLAGDLTDDGRTDQLNNFIAAIDDYSDHPRSDFYTVAGNHEYHCDDEMSAGRHCLDNYTSIINPDLQYVWGVGNIHFIMMSIDCYHYRPCDSTFAWLRNEVAANQDKNIVIVNHHPPDSWSEYMDILDDYKVDLVLYGHSHSSHANMDSVEPYGETLFVNAGAVDAKKYRYLIFTEGSKEVIIKSRDHKNHEFQDEYEKRTNLEYAFSG